MSFPRYPAYKATGMDWLGEVPEHWSVNRFKLSVDSCTNGVWGDEAGNDENDVICIRVADFDRHRLEAREPDEPTIRNVSDRDIEQRSLRNGDLLIEKSGGGEKQPVGAVVLYTGTAPAVCSNFVARMRLKRDLSPSFWRYAHHAAYSVRLNTKSIKQTSGIQNLDQQQYLGESAAYPPLQEQLAIASFLDRETAKIDTLIAEQQRLIELLQEKRQAVISHAVTKGLNPNAPMKDSGVEWLGEVPEHWDVKNISKVTSKITNGYVGPTRDILKPGGVPYIQATHIKGGEVMFDQNYFVEESWSQKHSKSILRKGDVLIVQTGAGTGDIGLVTEREEGFNCHALIILSTQEDLSGIFLAKVLMSAYGKQYLESIQTGGMHPHLNCGNVKFMPAPIPPIHEQIKIVESINRDSEVFRELIEAANKSSLLLKERRSTLISAAVTGQIDARGLVPQEEVA